MKLSQDGKRDSMDESTQLQDLDKSFSKHPLIAQKPVDEVRESRAVTPTRIPQRKPTEMDTVTCRICFDVETGSAPLLHPCRCAGSAKYIHEECLKAWLASRGNDLSKSECEVCKTPFLMKIKVHRKFSPRDVCKEGITQCLFTPLLLAVLGMLILIIYLLCNKYLNDNNSTEAKGYTIALIITCCLASLVISFLIGHTIRDACFTRKMEEWHIFSQEFRDLPKTANVIPVLDKPSVSTVLQPAEQGGLEVVLPPLLLIPKRMKVNGKRVTLPEIKPITMNLVLAQGKRIAVTPKLQSRSQTPIQYPLVTDPNWGSSSLYRVVDRRAMTPDVVSPFKTKDE